MPPMRSTIISVLAASISALALSGCSSSSSAASGSTAAKTSAVSAGTTAATATSPAATSPAATTASDTDATSPTSATITAPAANSTPAPASAPGKLNGLPKTCPSAAEVMSKLNLTALVLGGTDPRFCRYLFHGASGAPHVVITFDAASGMTHAAFEAGLKQDQSDVKPVPGLGDAAYTWAGIADSRGLSTLSGSTVFSILTTVPTATAGQIALAQAIIAG